MSQNTAQQESFVADQLDAAPGAMGSSGGVGYARLLRILGLILEQRGLSSFDLHVENSIFTVKGMVRPPSVNRQSLAQYIRGLFGAASSDTGRHDNVIQIELSFSVAEIIAMESKVQEQREADGKLPDLYGLSQILRGVGCYLEKRRDSTLIRVTVKDRWVMMAYRTADGRLERTQQDFEYFYNYSVKMYMQRSGREKLPLTSDPTLIVTWENNQQAHKLSRKTT